MGLTAETKMGDDRRPMRWVPDGSFAMGSEEFYPEERPVRRVTVEGFWMDEWPVRAGEFARFVGATGYVTLAERPLDPALYPDADPPLLVPGSLVFRPTPGPVDLTDWRQWWQYVPGANWRHPGGPGTSIHGRGDHPVVQVGYEDASAYAAWAGKRLPTETEWEFAARGGLDGAAFAWGDEHHPAGRPAANTWQGEFPWQNLRLDGYDGTSPVGCFAANGYGLLDVCGNVWEWTTSWFTPPAESQRAPCCGVGLQPGGPFPRRVIKGGSHLCAPNYCLRYRPAARQGEAIDTSTSHIGFRCVS